MNKSDAYRLMSIIKSRGMSMYQATNLLEKFPVIPMEVKLTIDYTKTLEECIKEAENPPWFSVDQYYVNNRNFPSKPKREEIIDVSSKLFYFGELDIIDIEEITLEMKKEGYQPGTIVDMLSLISGYPDYEFLIGGIDIVMLSSIWDTAGYYDHVAFLHDGKLTTRQLDGVYRDNCFFLGVKIL